MMRRCSAFLIPLILLIVTPCVNASITSVNCAPDGDGAITMSYTNWSGSEPYVLDMDGKQSWGPAHVAGDFITDTELDPTVKITQGIENDTTFAWTDYHITIGMSHTFSFVSGGFVGPTGWTITASAVTAGTIPNGNDPGYIATIDYVNATGSAIAIGDSGDFGFKISFLGTTAFCIEEYPTPEPATIALLGLGGLALIRRRIA
jgi:hypothetical protein